MVNATLDNTLGALQIGSLIAVFLFGIITRQAYGYFLSFPDDKWPYKVLVSVLWVLELTHTILVAHEVYLATITRAGLIDKLARLPFLGASVGVGGAITVLVHIFFSLRLWKVLPHPYCYIGLLCIGLTVTRFGASIYLTTIAVAAKSALEYRQRNTVLPAVLLAGGAMIDLIIAASMMYYLMHKREKSMLRITRLIDRLIQYTVRTGVVTSVGAIINLITHLALPRTVIWGAVYACLAKLYTNCLLSSLNERAVLREEISQTLTNIPSSPRPQDFRRFTPHVRSPVAIEMQTHVPQSNEYEGVEPGQMRRFSIEKVYPAYHSASRQVFEVKGGQGAV